MKILNYSEVIGKPSVIAEFDIYLDAGITFHKCKLIRTKKGYPMVKLPSYSVKKDDGTFAFFPYITFSENKEKEFNKKVLEELKPFLQPGTFPTSH